jgi:hypothetical protein
MKACVVSAAGVVLLLITANLCGQAVADTKSTIPAELELKQIAELYKNATVLLSSKQPKATLFGIYLQVDSAQNDGRSVYVYLRYKYASAVYTVTWNSRRGDLEYQGQTHTWWGYSTCDGEDIWRNATKKWTDIEKLVNYAVAQFSSGKENETDAVFYSLHYSVEAGCSWNIKMNRVNDDAEVAYKIDYKNKIQPVPIKE